MCATDNHSPNTVCLPTVLELKSLKEQKSDIFDPMSRLLDSAPPLAAVFQLLISIKLFSSQSRGQKKDKSTSLSEREAICIKMLGTYVFAVTSTNCPGRKWAAYNGVPAKEEDRSHLNKCQKSSNHSPVITIQSRLQSQEGKQLLFFIQMLFVLFYRSQWLN